MRNQWNSIESLAEDLGISERTAWRWLKKGRIERMKDKDGIVFTLTDITATDVTATDDTVTSERPSVSQMSIGGVKPKPIGPLAKFLVDELEANRALFQIDKVRTLRNEWAEQKQKELERKKRETEEAHEAEVKLRLQKESEEEEAWRKREIVQRLKDKVIPEPLRKELPSEVLMTALLAIESELSKFDLVSMPESELQIYADEAKNQIFSSPRYSPYVRQAVLRTIASELEKALRNWHEAWKRESRQNLNFETFVSVLFAKMLKESPKEAVEVFRLSRQLVNLYGNEEQKMIVDEKINTMSKILKEAMIQ